MARINVDDEFWADPRFDLLCMRIPKHEAVGAILCFWNVGQKYWKKEQSLIPADLFELMPHSAHLVATKFAVLKNGGVYCVGAKERWAFLLIKSEAGKKSAEARKLKGGSAIPQGATNHPDRNPSEQNRTDTEQTSEQPPNKTEPSSSSSVSSSSSGSDSGSVSVVAELFAQKPQLVPDPVDEEAAAERKVFPIRPELEDEAINDVVRFITPQTQERWIRDYKDANWIKESVKEAISFYTARGDATDGKWGLLLHKALIRAKNGPGKAKKANSKDEFDFLFKELRHEA